MAEPQIEEESSSYLDVIQGKLTRDQDQERTIRDRGRMALALFLILAGSVYGNVYQMRQVKEVHHISLVDEHGVVVTRLLRLPSQIPPDDPGRKAIALNYVKDWVQAARLRALDKEVTAAAINTALKGSAGPANVSLRTGYAQENVWDRIQKETVHVLMPKDPIWLAGNTWQAEWTEVIKARNVVTSQQQWSGRIQLAEQEEWATDGNPFGFKVVDFTADPFR